MPELFVCVDADQNKNKFWRITELADGILTEWGRIRGHDPTSLQIAGSKKYEGNPQTLYAKKVREKTREGRGSGTYTLLNVATTNDISPSKSAAGSLVAWESEETRKLVDYLTKVNIQHITSSSNIQVKNGQLCTVFGLLSLVTIAEARKSLGQIRHAFNTKKKPDSKLLNTYFRNIPRDVGHKINDYIEYTFLTTEQLDKESDLLDALEVSLETTAADEKPETERPQTKLTKADDKVDWAAQRFKKTALDMHVSKQWAPQRVWDIGRTAPFDDSVGNVQMYWHGTKASNLLSILYNGLTIPKTAANGWAFGQGIYFSDISTKSLNYACGYWDGKYDDTCYMLLCDVAMGKVYEVDGYNDRSLPKAGYDSTLASKKAGIQNNEMIVYRADRAKLRYLVEFKK